MAGLPCVHAHTHVCVYVCTHTCTPVCVPVFLRLIWSPGVHRHIHDLWTLKLIKFGGRWAYCVKEHLSTYFTKPHDHGITSRAKVHPGALEEQCEGERRCSLSFIIFRENSPWLTAAWKHSLCLSRLGHCSSHCFLLGEFYTYIN